MTAVSIRSLAFSCCAWSVAFALPAQGFYYPYHELLIGQAFVFVKKRHLNSALRLDEIIDRQAAIEASTQLDDDENGASDQYKHSMRPSGLDIRTAKSQSETDIKDQRRDAVRAAIRGDRVTAGRMIGRILHAVQDRKHLWCSCGPGSNPPQSAASCNSGPCMEGFGNHGLPDDCHESLRRFASTATISLRSFQLRTDFDPDQDQWEAAVARSVEQLESFLTDYASARRAP